ncbi:hypothetical protein HBI16_061340 [Parastagonospora nodorum]|nr:hypothetical protein HBI16_061340 [Parastagonospora nodorum]
MTSSPMSTTSKVEENGSPRAPYVTSSRISDDGVPSAASSVMSDEEVILPSAPGSPHGIPDRLTEENVRSLHHSFANTNLSPVDDTMDDQSSDAEDTVTPDGDSGLPMDQDVPPEATYEEVEGDWEAQKKRTWRGKKNEATPNPATPNPATTQTPVGQQQQPTAKAHSDTGIVHAVVTNMNQTATKDDSVDDKMDCDDDAGWVENSGDTCDIEQTVKDFILRDYAPKLHDTNMIKSLTADQCDLTDMFALRDESTNNTHCQDLPRSQDVSSAMANNKNQEVHVFVNYAAGTGVGPTWLGKDETDERSMAVRVNYNLGTQCPSITLRTPRLPEKKFTASDLPVTVHLTANHLKWSYVPSVGSAAPEESDRFITMKLAGRIETQAILDLASIPEAAKNALKSDRGYALIVKLNDDVPAMPTRGFTDDELNAISSACDENNDFDTSRAFLHRDLLGLVAFAAKELVIVGTCPMFRKKNNATTEPVHGRTYAQILDGWMSYMRKVFSINAILGGMWFYKQPGISEVPEVPRWLVKAFKWEERIVNDQTEYRYAEPLSWDKINRQDVWVKGSDMLLACKTGIQRQQSYQTQTVRAFLQTTDAVALEAEFMQLSRKGRQTNWAVNVFFATESFANKGLPVPIVDTRVKLRMPSPRGDGRLLFMGNVAAQNLGEAENAAFTVVMRCENKIVGEFGGRGNRYAAELTTVDDSKPNYRRLIAMNRILRRPDGPDSEAKGADFYALLTGEDNRRIGADALSEILKTPENRTSFDNVISATRPLLNKTQKAFAKASSTSQTGVDLLHGPPGTGKTKTLIATVGAHASAGISVLYTSGQNAPVKDSLAKFRQLSEQNPAFALQEHEWVYFTGSASRISSSDTLKARLDGSLVDPAPATAVDATSTPDAPTPEESTSGADSSMDRNGDPASANDDTPVTGAVPDAQAAARQQAQEDAELRAALREMHRLMMEQDSQNVDIKETFGYKLNQRISVYLTRGIDDHEYTLAMAYTNARELLKDRTLTGQDRIYQSDRLGEIEDDLALWYLRYEVKVVFCTLSTSSDAYLITGFKPQLLVVDEAAKASVTDIIIPIVGFGCFPSNDIDEDVDGSLLSIIVAGDHKQGKPINLGEHQNEFHAAMGMNLFQRLIDNDSGGHGIHVLDRCYRMLPKLLDWPADTFYNRGSTANPSVRALTADPSVLNTEVPLQNTLTAFHVQMFGKQYNKSPRVVLDVSGPDVKHIQWARSTSRANESEAERILQYVEELLAFTPPSDGRKIKLGDFGISTCYTGQAQCIRAAANKRGLHGLKIVTADQAQGLEFRIFIVSTVISPEGQDFPQPKEDLPIRFIAEAGKVCVLMTRAQYQLTLVGDFKCFTQASVSSHASMVSNKVFASLIKDIRSKQDIISQRVWKDRKAPAHRWTKNDFVDTEINMDLNLRSDAPPTKRSLVERPPGSGEPAPKRPFAGPLPRNIQQEVPMYAGGGRGRGDGRGRGRGRGDGRGRGRGARGGGGDGRGSQRGGDGRGGGQRGGGHDGGRGQTNING